MSDHPDSNEPTVEELKAIRGALFDAAAVAAKAWKMVRPHEVLHHQAHHEIYAIIHEVNAAIGAQT